MPECNTATWLLTPNDLLPSHAVVLADLIVADDARRGVSAPGICHGVQGFRESVGLAKSISRRFAAVLAPCEAYVEAIAFPDGVDEYLVAGNFGCAGNVGECRARGDAVA